MIQRIFSILLIGLLTISCKKKPLPPATPAPIADAPIETPPAPVPESVTVDTKTESAAAWVRITSGAMPAQDTVAAILNLEEIADVTLREGRIRYALTPLPNWTEADLSKPSTKFVVFRDQTKPDGTSTNLAFPARLMKFDAAAGVGLLAYLDISSPENEGGFRIADQTGDLESLILLRLSRDSNSPLASVERSKNATPGAFTMDGGKLKNHNGHLQETFPPVGTSSKENSFRIAVDSNGKLVGFLDAADDLKFTTAAEFDTTFKVPAVEISGVKFRDENSRNILESLSFVATENGILPPAVQLTIGEVTRSAAKHLTELDQEGHYPRIEGKTAQMLTTLGYLTENLPEPKSLSQIYALQAVAPLLPPTEGKQTQFPPDAPGILSRPFFIKVERTAEGLIGTIIDPTVFRTEPDTASSSLSSGKTSAPETFPLESAAKDVHLIAGGREAILALEGSPRWKRFSFEKNAWLSLPPLGPNSYVTGNLNAIYTLDRDNGEIAKYLLPDLKPGGKIKLPPGEYSAILAGCNSAKAPIHVISPGTQLALDPDTLSRRNTPQKPPSYVRKDEIERARGKAYLTSGDGLGVGAWDGGYDITRRSYNGDEKGLDWPYLGIERHMFRGVLGVSNGFYLEQTLCSLDNPGGEIIKNPSIPAMWDSATPALAENSPIIFRLRQPSGKNPSQTILGVFGFSQVEPFAEFEVPELAGLTKSSDFRFQRFAFFDPYSRRVATLGTDKKTWNIRKLEIPEKLAQPVLLNWPDTTITRGEEFSFRPILAGGTRFEAVLSGNEDKPPAGNFSDLVNFPVRRDQLESLQLLKLKIPGAEGREINYPILLHTSGPALPYSTLPSAPIEGLNTRWTTLAQLGAGGAPAIAHETATYHFQDPILDILGPVNGYAVLVKANRVDFFSLQDRRVAGTCGTSPKTTFYPSAGGLLEYDVSKKSLSRIAIPAGTREAFFTHPSNSILNSIGTGILPGSPVVITGGVVDGTKELRIAGSNVTLNGIKQFSCVLDGKTLRPLPKLQFESLDHFLSRNNELARFEFRSPGAASDPPKTLPTSFDGRMINLPNGFLTFQPGLALIYPFANGKDLTFSSWKYNGNRGSETGLITICNGQAHKAADPIGKGADYRDLGASPSGKYRLIKADSGVINLCVDVVATETHKSILRLGGIPYLSPGSEGGKLFLLGDAGPLAILNDTGHTMSLVDLDVAETARKLLPDETHVISQPIPYLCVNQSTNYQVRVSNPEAVESYRLQRPVRGATLSPQGLLTFQAPTQFTGPANETISVEILTKKGETVLHEFPIYILPDAKQRPKPPTPTPTPTPKYKLTPFKENPRSER